MVRTYPNKFTHVSNLLTHVRTACVHFTLLRTGSPLVCAYVSFCFTLVYHLSHEFTLIRTVFMLCSTCSHLCVLVHMLVALVSMFTLIFTVSRLRVICSNFLTLIRSFPNALTHFLLDCVHICHTCSCFISRGPPFILYSYTCIFMYTHVYTCIYMYIHVHIL